MTNALARNLRNFGDLSPSDELELDRVASERQGRFGPREEISPEGAPPDHLHLVLSGWACRYKDLPNGRRQIVAFALPGDLCDDRLFLLKRTDHAIGALTPVTIGRVGPATIDALAVAHPRIWRAMRWHWQVQSSTQREWIVNLGHRGASERLAHLLCEIHMRLRLVGLAEESMCDLPLTQAELGDATGLSTVHVNRVLQELRNAGLIVLRERILTIPDLAALRDAAMFDGSYLHGEQEGLHLDVKE